MNRQNWEPRHQRRKKAFPVKKLIGVFAVLIIVVVLLWQAPAIIAVFNSSNPSSPFSGYTKITLVVSQPYSAQFGSSVYGFGYAGPTTDPVTQQQDYEFSVIPEGIVGTQTFNAVQGATYNALGLKIIVGQVNSDYLILYVKSTVP